MANFVETRASLLFGNKEYVNVSKADCIFVGYSSEPEVTFSVNIRIGENTWNIATFETVDEANGFAKRLTR